MHAEGPAAGEIAVGRVVTIAVDPPGVGRTAVEVQDATIGVDRVGAGRTAVVMVAHVDDPVAVIVVEMVAATAGTRHALP